MEKSKLILPATILLMGIIVGGFYYASMQNKRESVEIQPHAITDRNNANIKAQEEAQQRELQSKTEADNQLKCKRSAEETSIDFQKSFTEQLVKDNWEGELPQERETTVFSDVKVNHKYAYSTNTCFVEVLISGLGETKDSHRKIQIQSKLVYPIISANPTLNDSPKARFEGMTYQSGSQILEYCDVSSDMLQLPTEKRYDAENCKTESEFDSWVSERYGIK